MKNFKEQHGIDFKQGDLVEVRCKLPEDLQAEGLDIGTAYVPIFKGFVAKISQDQKEVTIITSKGDKQIYDLAKHMNISIGLVEDNDQ